MGMGEGKRGMNTGGIEKVELAIMGLARNLALEKFPGIYKADPR